MAVSHLRLGVVSSFDDPVGIGEITDRDGMVLDFHCTAIADGTRTIGQGEAVAFRVVASHRGIREAVDVRPLEASR